jgi:hypothetical protein
MVAQTAHNTASYVPHTLTVVYQRACARSLPTTGPFQNSLHVHTHIQRPAQGPMTSFMWYKITHIFRGESCCVNARISCVEVSGCVVQGRAADNATKQDKRKSSKDQGDSSGSAKKNKDKDGAGKSKGKGAEAEEAATGKKKGKDGADKENGDKKKRSRSEGSPEKSATKKSKSKRE